MSVRLLDALLGHDEQREAGRIDELQRCEIEADVYLSLGDKFGLMFTENRSRRDVELTLSATCTPRWR